jgi:hypothetical protein
MAGVGDAAVATRPQPGTGRTIPAQMPWWVVSAIVAAAEASPPVRSPPPRAVGALRAWVHLHTPAVRATDCITTSC